MDTDKTLHHRGNNHHAAALHSNEKPGVLSVGYNGTSGGTHGHGYDDDSPRWDLDDHRGRIAYVAARAQDRTRFSTTPVGLPLGGYYYDGSRSSPGARDSPRARRYDHYSPVRESGERHGPTSRAEHYRRPSTDSGYGSSIDPAKDTDGFTERRKATGANATAVAERREAGKGGNDGANTERRKRKRDDDDVTERKNKRPSGVECYRRAQYPDIYRGVYSRRG
jgi:hypothetical protein